MGSGAFLSTAEVARRLGVKPATVYAYASRGLLTSVRRSDRRGSTFAVEEVELLAQRGRAGRSPAGAVERIRTAITTLDGDDLYYRSHRVVDLAGSASFESVAELLWADDGDDGVGAGAAGGPVPVSWPPVAPELLAAVSSSLAALPAGSSAVDQARVAVVVLGALDPRPHDLGPAAVTAAARTALGALAATLGAPRGAPAQQPGGVAEHLWTGLAGRPGTAREVALLEVAMVLLADHGLAVSTLAARLAASTRADVHAVLGAGLAAADGQEHAGASLLAHDLLVRALDDPAAALAEHLRAGRGVPGFGHRVYQRQDPRAELLLSLLPDAPATRAVDALCEQLAGRPELFPTVDLALAALVHAHGLRPDAGQVVFEVARIAGWVAHALEEHTEPDLRFRALGLYTGEPPRRAQAAGGTIGRLARGLE